MFINVENSWMYKKFLKEHNGNVEGVQFHWKARGKFNKTYQRQVQEAYKIYKKTDVENWDSIVKLKAWIGNRLKFDKHILLFFCNDSSSGVYMRGHYRDTQENVHEQYNWLV